nr:hypothetical protein [Tanacetum cinerariifolium]
MTWHAAGKCIDLGKMQHPVDGRAWKIFDTRHTYNLPSWLCMKESSLMPTLLILGPKSLGKDIDVYFWPLIDDLKDIWALKGCSGEGYMACPTCNEDTSSVCLLSNTAYIEKNVLENFLNTLLMKDKSKDATKARQDLKNLGIRRKSFINSSKELNYQMGLDPTSSTKLQQYLHSSVATPIIELCLFFKQICARTLIEANMSVIWLDHQEMKKVIWYVLHNSPEIDMYQAKFQSQFSNQDMKEEFPGWFGSQIHQRYIDKDLGVSASGALFTLACGPTSTPISVNSCIGNGVRFVVHNRDECRTTQNSGICSPSEKDREMYYDQLEEILESSGVIVVDNDHDVIHFDNSSDLSLSTSFNDLDVATLNIDSQSMDNDAPPDIIDVDENDDFIDDKDIVPHDLAVFDDEVLTNDDDDVVVVYSRGHGGDAGGDDRPLHVRLAPVAEEGEAENPTGESNLIGEIIREFPMYYPSWHKIEPEKKAGVLGSLWADWDTQIDYWLDPKNDVRGLQNAQNRAKSKMESFETQECPSLIQNYFDTHTVDGVFAQDEARVQYEEMIRLRDLGANTSTGVPYTEDQIMAMVRRGKQWGHIPGVSKVLAGQGRDAISINEPRCTHTNADVDEVNEDNKRLRKELAMLRTIIRSDDRMSQLLTQLESEHEIGSDSESGRGGDDEPGTNEDAGRDEDDDGDEES